MRSESYWTRLVETATRFLEDRKVLCFCIFSLFYILGACGEASSKPFWFDEIISWHIAKLPNSSDIWNALKEGIDGNPPLSYFLIRGSHWFFGTGELATRLPSIMGFWLALFFLFLIIKKRFGTSIAYIAILYLCLSASYSYAFEARPYALVLACSCASLFCWELAIEGHFRRLALIGLALSLGVALFSHFYATLLFAPLMAGEAYRSLRSRRLDWPIWIAMLVGATVLIPLIPMMLKLREYSGFFWGKPTKGMFLESINWFFFDPLLLCFYVAGCVIGLPKAGYSSALEKRNELVGWNVPSHELVAAITLMLLPVVCFVLAKLVTHAFTYRYFIPTAIGIALGLAFLYQRLLRGHLFVTAALLVTLLIVFTVRQGVDVRGFVSKKSDLVANKIASVLSAAGDSPVVLTHPMVYLLGMHYASPGLQSRLWYLIDLKAVRKSGVDTSDRNLEGLRKWVPMRVEDHRSFLLLHNHFYLYGPPASWQIRRFQEEGVQFKVKSIEEKGVMLLEVFVNDSLSRKAK